MKKLFSLMLAMVMIAAAVVIAAPAYARGPDFDDVPHDRWSYESVAYAVDNNYMIGTGGGLFSPEKPLTRAMVATVLWRRAGCPAPEKASGFEDVPAGSWFADAVAWAKSAGVVSGVSKTRFAPDSNVTREQLATMLFRFSQDGPIFVTERADLKKFSDFGSVSSWATDALAWAVAAGLVKGVSGGRLSPGGNATREQFAAIVYRYDGTFVLKYNEPVILSSYTEKEYPLVKDADFYVSTTGSDDNDGSFRYPFATFAKAVEAVRGLDKTGRDGITVAFMAGEYGALSLSLNREDSGTGTCPVTYCAYGDGPGVFNNGFDVAAGEFVPISEDEKALFSSKSAGSVKKADISDRLTSYDPRTQLVMNGSGALALARFPNRYEDGTDNLVSGAGLTLDDNHIRITFSLIKNRIKTYHNVSDIMLYGYLTTGWYKDILETDGYTIDDGTGGYDFLIPHPETSRAGRLRYLEYDGFDSEFWNKTAIVGVSEELDAADEYWIDAERGILYAVDPAEDYHFTSGDVPMISLDHVSNVGFKGLTFKNSNNMEIDGNYCDGISIDLCDFSGCSNERMVALEYSKNVTVTDSNFSLCAGEAVKISGMKPDPDGTRFYQDNGVLVDNNYFTHTSLTNGNTAAVGLGRMSGPVVSHNVFKDCLWGGISYSGTSNMTAEYNVFDHMMYNGDDFGAVYNWASFVNNGNVIRYNLFMNIQGGTNGRMAIYHDNTTGNYVYSNIFFNCDTPVMNNDISKYNFFEDNIVIDTDTGFSGDYVSYHTDTAEEVAEAQQTGNFDAVTSHEFYVSWVQAFADFDSMPVVKAALLENERWAGYFDITTDLSRIGDPEFCLNNSLTVTGNRSFSPYGAEHTFREEMAKYSVIENNLAFTLEENPVFVNPTLGDYRIRSGVDFPDLQFEKIGRY